MLNEQGFDLLFREARTFSGWQDKRVSEETLRGIYDLLKMAPTGANCSPGRFIFVTSDAEKEKLKSFLDGGNVEKTMSAPVTVIIAHDLRFHDKLPELFPHADAKSWYEGRDALIKKTAFLNGSLQGAYLMMAARATGLDCGPMAGFKAAGVKDAFFADEDVEVNFLCNLGYGDVSGLHPRLPRLSFDEVCKII